LTFPDLPGLRPTGDRVRETLFNWLQPIIANARCLDLFAGSGALGLEAASRGAKQVVMLDQAPQVIMQLEHYRSRLGLDQLEIIKADAVRWLDGNPRTFDLVFVDPPFAADILPLVCRKLEAGGWLAEHGIVYLEDDSGRLFNDLPHKWHLRREKRAGQVRFALAQR
jgi:16S rRNA (guanine966-N2)-methyltransferase